jgi:Fic family protein
MYALGRLDEATGHFPNALVLVRPTVRREAVSTSALEGTFTDLEEVLAVDPNNIDDLGHDMREVVNAILATDYGVAQVTAGRAMSVQLACELQEILIRGTRTEGPDSGRIRRSNVFIGRDDQRVPDTRFIPVPAGPQLEDGIRGWEAWVNSESEVHLIARVALAHYQFETIHPFHDGNGRVGRILAILQLMSGGALQYPVLALSSSLEAHADSYRDGLAAVSETGDFDAWVAFFAQAIGQQARVDCDRVDRLLTMRKELMDRVRDARARGLAVQVAEDLIGFPFVRVREIADRYGSSFEAANKVVSRLVDIGMLRQVGDSNYDRLFVAPDVMRVLRH